eukprot:s2674_g1.t1
MATAPAPGQAMSKDPKTQLNHFCQRYCQRPVTKSDISYTTNKFGNQYQAIVKLDCIQGQEYAGHLCINQKDAEKSAAEQAVMAFSSQMAVLKPPVQRDKKRKPRTPEEIAERKAKQEAEGNPAITPKTLLNALVMKIAKRYLQKGETVYETKTYNGGGHQDSSSMLVHFTKATVKLSALPGEWSERMWAGHVCTTKQKAEQSAAEIALESIKQDKELMEEADKPKGFGKGGKGKGKGFMWDPWQWGWMWGMPSSELPRKDVLTESITGEVIEWKESHGWIKADVELDHKAASRREGKIFVGKSDAPEDGLVAGAKVSFTVYEDPHVQGSEYPRASFWICAMPLRWPFYPAFIGWVLRCFLREDFTVSFHVIVWNVALYMERFLPPFNVAVCYYGEVGADGSRLQLRARSALSSMSSKRGRSPQLCDGSPEDGGDRKDAKKLKKIKKKAKKEAKKAKKAAKKLKKMQKLVQKRKDGKSSKAIKSDSSSDSSSSSSLPFVMDMDFSSSSKELDPRNPDSRIQRALGLTCGAFSFIERKDDEEVYKDGRKAKYKDGEDQSKDWICLRSKANGEPCGERNFPRNEKCFRCGGLRQNTAPLVRDYKPNKIDGRKF